MPTYPDYFHQTITRARDFAEKNEKSMQPLGQIKVTVVRETLATESAR